VASPFRCGNISRQAIPFTRGNITDTGIRSRSDRTTLFPVLTLRDNRSCLARSDHTSTVRPKFQPFSSYRLRVHYLSTGAGLCPVSSPRPPSRTPAARPSVGFIRAALSEGTNAATQGYNQLPTSRACPCPGSLVSGEAHCTKVLVSTNPTPPPGQAASVSPKGSTQKHRESVFAVRPPKPRRLPFPSSRVDCIAMCVGRRYRPTTVQESQLKR